MGAINKTTCNYEYPKIATKQNKYKCPECDKDIIFRNGKIISPHFAHKKSTNPCHYFDKPTESQIHKDAKLLMKTLLDNKQIIIFQRKCVDCHFTEPTTDIFSISYNSNQTAIIEYKFNYNNSNKSADVALVENNNIKYIFEICYKNKTKEENRPEPWFEIDAKNLINNINSGISLNEDSELVIECIRNHKCNMCKSWEEFNSKRYNLFIENLKIKEQQQQNEEIERNNMCKEDDRVIQLQLKHLEIQKNLMMQYKLKKEDEEKLNILKTQNEEKLNIIRTQNLEKQELELEYIHKKKREELINKQKDYQIVKNYQPSVANYFKKK